MVVAVHASNRTLYARELDSMHRDRKTVFVDLHKWNLTATGDHEYDQFDIDQAVYLIDADPVTGQHVCSIRLLPTSGPNLLADVFPQLCEGEIPRSDDVWEITRMCFAPHLRGRERRAAHNNLALATAEFGLVYGIRQFSLMAYLNFLPDVIAQGWDSTPLGLPKQVDDQQPVAAITVNVTPAILQHFRQKYGVSRPVLELAMPRAA